jgi:hypothetical protein
LDVENALRFDNKLIAFDTTPQGLLVILNFAAGIQSGNGGYPQIGGLRYSFDPSKPTGEKVRSAALYDLAGTMVAKLVENGVVASSAPNKITLVTLNFTANGGDGYPIKANADNFRYLLSDGSFSAPIAKELDFTAVANVPSKALGEQDAFKAFLQAYYPAPEQAYDKPDTSQMGDLRIQNLGVKAVDTVLADLNTPMLKPRVNGLRVSELFTIGEAVGKYLPTGTPDGMGAYLKDANTIRLLVQSEITKTSGYAYKLGNGTELTGARIHYLDIDKASSQVIGAGLAYSKVVDRAGKEVTLATQISGDASGNAGFDRFCAANLIEANSFGAGKGFVDRIHLLGEESSSANNSLGGTMVALDVASGTLHAVPDLGFGSWESATAVDTGNTNQVALLLGDDYASATVGAPIYIYVGNKSTAPGASFLERNGLSGGKLYAWVAEQGAALNRPSEFKGYGTTASGKWVEIATKDATKAGTTGYDALGYKSAALLRADADSKNAFLGARIEDVDVNPNKTNQVAFVATGNETFDGGSDLLGTVYTIDVNFSAGVPSSATLKVVYDGDDTGNGSGGLRSPDNIAFSKDGFLYIQEDKAVYGSDADVKYGLEKGSIWKVDPKTGKAIRWAQIDDTIDPDGSGGQALDKNDSGYKAYGWESSGITDVSALYNHAAGTDFFANVQTHGVKGGAIADFNLAAGGQILKLERSIPTVQVAAPAPEQGTFVRLPYGTLASPATLKNLFPSPITGSSAKVPSFAPFGLSLDLKPTINGYGTGARVIADPEPMLKGLDASNRALAAYSVDLQQTAPAPVAMPLTYNPLWRSGATFFDLNNDSTPDLLDLKFEDGNYGDQDGSRNGLIASGVTVAAVPLSAALIVSGSTLNVADPVDSTTPAAQVLRATLTGRAGSVNQIGYVTLAPGESQTLTHELLRDRGRLLFANLESTDVPDLSKLSFQRDMPVVNGQRLLLFEVVDATLPTLLAQGTTQASIGSSIKVLELRQSGSEVIASSTTGNVLSLQLPGRSSLGLGELISNPSGEGLFFDFTALSGTPISGSVTVAREALYDTKVGFYKIERNDGAVLDRITNTLVLPGQPGYEQAALHSENLFRSFGTLEAVRNGTGSAQGFSSFVDAGLVAPYGRVVTTGDTFFAFSQANKDGLNHFRSLGTGKLGFEDWNGGFDLDYDDLITSFTFNPVSPASPIAPSSMFT